MKVVIGAYIPEIASAIKVNGKAGEGGRIVLDIPGNQEHRIFDVMELRGKPLVVILMDADDVEVEQ
jgi:hypothetical protein